MITKLCLVAFSGFLVTAPSALSMAPADVAKLPAAAGHEVDFSRDIKPLFETSCVKCHAKGKEKGDFSLETRDSFLKGGETGAGAVVGKSAESLVVEAVSGLTPDLVMPKKGAKWTPEQVGLLRAWIDQGAVWPPGVTFAKPPPRNLRPRPVELAERGQVHPLDDLLATYFSEHGLEFPRPVSDRVYIRRVSLDLVGLLPPAAEVERFAADPAGDKRRTLVRRLLSERRDYAEHWLTFWNDLLRNDYKGAGFIDGGRKQISRWLYQALLENKPYGKFVAELVNPSETSEGFTRGIIWRGNVNASMLPPMQAAQSVSQVFLGVNLKCASCHDSFVSDWTLSDAYGMAAVYSDQALELIHCDKPTGKKATLRFLYPELGVMDPEAARPQRLARFAEILTGPQNGRLSRTIVNRLWERLLGRGLVEPLDDMERPAWDADLLDWLAEDFTAHGGDLKHTLELICTSQAYQMPAVEMPGGKEEYVFRGPLTRRLTAEQFTDAVNTVTGEWPRLPSSLEFDFTAANPNASVTMPQWVWTAEPASLAAQRAAVRVAVGKLDTAEKAIATAREKLAQSLVQAGPAYDAARAGVEAAVQQLQAAQLPAASGFSDADRHKVVFRKRFHLIGAPTESYAAILSSQSFEVLVNGKPAKALQRDGFRNGRIALLDLRTLLKPGENLIALDIASHTEKQMNDSERAQFPGSANHLNAASGVAFYLRCTLPNGVPPVEIRTDDTWAVRRNPELSWNASALDDAGWARATILPAGKEPVDEGPSLPPVHRQDFANIAVHLGPQLIPVVSTIAQPGRIRAAMLAADPLQVALDRPNREVVIPSRASVATTIQALELTNGGTLDGKLRRTASGLAAEAAKDPGKWVDAVFAQALARPPSGPEREAALELLGATPAAENVADFLWSLFNLPEFQLIN